MRSENKETGLAPRRKGYKVHIGDVFQIPIDDARVGYGQVIAQHLSSYLVAIFKAARSADQAANVPSIVSDDIAFFTETLDAKLWNRDWPVVGNAPPAWSSIQLPNYKVAFGGTDNMHVEAYDGKRHRPATQREIEILRFRTVCSAMRVQQAFQAFHHAIPWDDRYADILDPEYCRRSAEIRLSRLALPGWKILWERLTSKTGKPVAALDDMTLNHLKLAGANLGKATEVINSIYFKDEKNARSASSELVKSGYTVQGPSKGSQGFLVTAKGQLIPSVNNIASMRRAMEAIAKEFRGDYDGWEAAITP